MDFLTVPTATFRVLYVFIVLSHNRRHIVHFNATEHPTAQWTAQQLVEAFPFDTAPRYLLRDRDAIYGKKVKRRIKSLGIDEVITAPATARLLPRASLALAEPVCGTCYRIDSQRVPRSCDSPQRTAPTQNPSRLLRLLPYLQNSLVVEQRST